MVQGKDGIAGDVQGTQTIVFVHDQFVLGLFAQALNDGQRRGFTTHMNFLGRQPQQSTRPRPPTILIPNQLYFIDHRHIVVLIDVHHFRRARHHGGVLLFFRFLARTKAARNVFVVQPFKYFPRKKSQRTAVDAVVGLFELFNGTMRFTTVGGPQVANDFSSLTPCFGKPKVGLEKVGGGSLGQGQLTVPQWVCGWWLGGKVAPREHQAGGSVLSKHGSWSTEVDRSKGGVGLHKGSLT